jgi:hypothetical protein
VKNDTDEWVARAVVNVQPYCVSVLLTVAAETDNAEADTQANHYTYMV